MCSRITAQIAVRPENVASLPVSEITGCSRKSRPGMIFSTASEYSRIRVANDATMNPMKRRLPFEPRSSSNNSTLENSAENIEVELRDRIKQVAAEPKPITKYRNLTS